MAIDGSSLMYSPILRGVDGLSARANVVVSSSESGAANKKGGLLAHPVNSSDVAE